LSNINEIGTIHILQNILQVNKAVENDVDTLHEEIIHLVRFSFIRVIDERYVTSDVIQRACLVPKKFCKIFQIPVTLNL